MTSSKPPSSNQQYSKPCSICSFNDDLPLVLGDFYTQNDISVHYFCLLLSTNLPQNGKDSSGILGFFLKDIRKESKEAQNRTCKYCKKTGASIMCKTCEEYFHILCGFNKCCNSEFFDKFTSYCHEHVQIESNPPSDPEPLCGICECEFSEDYHPVSWITTPCCKRGYVHLLCMRKAALTAGYLFKCIFCKDSQFRDSIKSQNVFVPDRDALWEKEDRFKDLYKKIKRCDHIKCICPHGKTFESTSGLWVIYMCKSCSMKGFHKGCMNINSGTEFTCNTCSKVLENGNKNLSFEDTYSHSFYIPKNSSNLGNRSSTDLSSELEPTQMEIDSVICEYLERSPSNEETCGGRGSIDDGEFVAQVKDKLRTIALLKRKLP